MNRNVFLLVLLAAVGCSSSTAKTVPIQTATIQRRDIIVTAEATGVIEPINVVEVKSKTASGQVMAMPIDIGYFIKPGDLIVQIDTTILHQQFVQATADYTSAKSNLTVAQAQLKRQQDLYNQHIITLDVLESAQNAAASATASEVRNHANVDLAAQALVDAKVVATTVGTILTKPVSIGQVIQAGGTSVSGGTIIATMADLTKVRARALVAETDIGMVKPGQTVNVTVDAFPDHPFIGKVDHIEPQATVQQNVTMFATLIALDNSEGLLQPGMNGEVSIVADTRLDAIAVPNDAIRSPREAAQAAALLGLNADSVRAQLKAQGGGGGGGQGGQGGGPGGQGGRGGRQVQVANGELAPELQGGGQGGGGMGRGRGPQVQVTDADCKKVDDAMKKKPAVAKKIDDMRTKMREPGADRQKMMADMKAAYEQVGVDMQISGACARRNRDNAGGAGGAGAAGGAAGAGGGARTGGRGGRGGAGGAGAAGGAQQEGNNRTRPRSGLVFIQKGTTWEPKTIRLGVANYDYTEVLGDGLKEGDKVAMLSAAALQAKRQQQNDQMKAGASPLGGSAPGGGGGRGPGRGN